METPKQCKICMNTLPNNKVQTGCKYLTMPHCYSCHVEMYIIAGEKGYLKKDWSILIPILWERWQTKSLH